MQIENHKEEVPFAHYEAQFSQADPAEILARVDVKWDGKEFYVNLLGREFAISHPAYAIRALDGGALPPAAYPDVPAALLVGKQAGFLGRGMEDFSGNALG